MPQQPDARHMLAEAERAANAGDLASADGFLRQAARIQETELGPLHPDLASTMNNLAIVAEKTGRPGDAETFYRRAAAIASASLPAGHPMVAASRQNLEDFCRASGLPIDAPDFLQFPAEKKEPGPSVIGREAVDAAIASPKAPAAGHTMPAAAQPSRTASTAARPAAAAATRPLPVAPRTAPRPLPWLALLVLAVVAAALFVTKPWSSSGDRETVSLEGREESPATVTADPPAPPAAEPAETAPGEPGAAAGPAEQPGSPAAGAPPAPTRPTGGITLAVAELCRTFSTSGGSWRCDPAGDSVAPGRLFFYTRVRSPRNTEVVHRWYRGDTLRQTVTLTIRANPTQGYRTYSRQTVDSGNDWRVEITNRDGDRLHEQRFAVR